MTHRQLTTGLYWLATKKTLSLHNEADKWTIASYLSGEFTIPGYTARLLPCHFYFVGWRVIETKLEYFILPDDKILPAGYFMELLNHGLPQKRIILPWIVNSKLIDGRVIVCRPLPLHPSSALHFSFPELNPDIKKFLLETSDLK